GCGIPDRAFGGGDDASGTPGAGGGLAGPGQGGSPGEGGGGAGDGTGAGTSGEGGGATGGTPYCGNGVLDEGEACDGDDLGDATCADADASFVGGRLSCRVDCQFNTSACSSTCGNGVV